MSEKKYQIFISSTYTDLVEARDKIISTILTMYHFPIGMEMFSADDDEQWEVIRETIDQSDYYVLILGQRYGSLAADGRSYTEKEYDYAKSLGIPVLSFIRDPEMPTKPSERENDPEKIQKLLAFIEKAKGIKMCDFWKTPDDLAHKVSLALPKAFRRHPRIGWAKADKIASPEILEELASLSKENRLLRDELEKLRASVIERTPNLQVTLNKKSELAITFIKYSGYNKFDYPKELNIKEIGSHLLPYIDKEDIEEYNSNLPSQEEIDEYNQSKELGERIKQSGIDLFIDVRNFGSAKADNLYITISFPEEIMVLEKDEGQKLIDVKEPKIPKNPLKEAQRKYSKEHGMRNGVSSFLNMGSAIDLFGPRLHSYDNVLKDFNAFPVMSNIDRTASTTLKGNMIVLEIDDLLHTLERSFDEEYIFLPLCEGTFEVKVSIICEQYSKEETYIIPLTIDSNIVV